MCFVKGTIRPRPDVDLYNAPVDAASSSFRDKPRAREEATVTHFTVRPGTEGYSNELVQTKIEPSIISCSSNLFISLSRQEPHSERVYRTVRNTVLERHACKDCTMLERRVRENCTMLEQRSHWIAKEHPMEGHAERWLFDAE